MQELSLFDLEGVSGFYRAGDETIRRSAPFVVKSREAGKVSSDERAVPLEFSVQVPTVCCIGMTNTVRPR